VDLSVSGAADGVVVVDVGGSVDVYTASELRSGLVVDLQDVDFMDSTGLGVLVARLKMVRHQNGWLRLVCTNEKVLRVFRITGLDKVFSIHDSVDGALENAPR
jgi:anti-sigma B factor antagonist